MWSGRAPRMFPELVVLTAVYGVCGGGGGLRPDGMPEGIKGR